MIDDRVFISADRNLSLNCVFLLIGRKGGGKFSIVKDLEFSEVDQWQ